MTLEDSGPGACTCFWRRIRLPQDGQYVRVTLLRDVELWQNNRRVIIQEGTSYEGTAEAVDIEGFFELVDDTGERHKFYIHDKSFEVEVRTQASAV